LEVYGSILLYLYSLLVFPGVLFILILLRLFRIKPDRYALIFLSLGFLVSPLSVLTLNSRLLFNVIIGSVLATAGLSYLAILSVAGVLL
jgi:hypothetical protein